MDIGVVVLALSAFFGYALFFDVNSVMFSKATVPAALEYQGYKGEVVSAQLANELKLINIKARTIRDLRRFELPDNESAVAALGEYFEFLAPLRAAQQMIGLVEYTFTSDVVKYGDGYRMQVRGAQNNTDRHFTATEDGEKPEELIRKQAINVARFIDPYVVASYAYQTTVDNMSADVDPSVDFSWTVDEIDHCLAVMPREERYWPYNLWGVVYLRGNDAAHALQVLDKALTVKSDFILAIFNRGQALLALKRYNEAIEAFKETIRVDAAQGRKARTPHAYAKWAVALKEQGKFDEAEALFKKADQVTPGFAIAHYDWGMMLKERGDLKGAREHFERAVDTAPERSMYRAALASVSVEE